MPLALSSVNSQYSFYRAIRHVDVISRTSIRFRPTNTVLTYNASIVYGPDDASSSYSGLTPALMMTSTNYAFTTQNNLELTASYYETTYGGANTIDVFYGPFPSGPEYWQQTNGIKYVNYASNPSQTVYDAGSLSMIPGTSSLSFYNSQFFGLTFSGYEWGPFGFLDDLELSCPGVASVLDPASYIFNIYIGGDDYSTAGGVTFDLDLEKVYVYVPNLYTLFTSGNTLHITFADIINGGRFSFDIIYVTYP